MLKKRIYFFRICLWYDLFGRIPADDLTRAVMNRSRSADHLGQLQWVPAWAACQPPLNSQPLVLNKPAGTPRSAEWHGGHTASLLCLAFPDSPSFTCPAFCVNAEWKRSSYLFIYFNFFPFQKAASLSGQTWRAGVQRRVIRLLSPVPCSFWIMFESFLVKSSVTFSLSLE